MRTTWIYLTSWLLGADHRIVGVEVREHRGETSAKPDDREYKALGMWRTDERQSDDALDWWARQHYEITLGGTAIPIRHKCAAEPTIRIEREVE